MAAAEVELLALSQNKGSPTTNCPSQGLATYGQELFPSGTSNQLRICLTFSCPFLKIPNVFSHTASVVVKTTEMTTVDNHTSAFLSRLCLNIDPRHVIQYSFFFLN